MGIPYLREEDIKHVTGDLHSIFDHIEQTDPETFTFLSDFVDNYIEGYWLNEWDHSEISFWGDMSHFSSEHMSNNALESYNNELYTLLGRHPHPNPYKFLSTLKRALSTTKKILGWVEKGDYEEVKSQNARRAVDKRQRLKVQYINRLKRADSEVQQRIARLKYMKATGSTNTRIIAKGKRKVAERAQNKSLLDSSGKMGRPSYKRIKAPQQKKCRFCGKIFKSKGGCTNHEKDCKLSGSLIKIISCCICSKSFKSKMWLKRHEDKCHLVQKQEHVNREKRSSFISSSDSNASTESDHNDDISVDSLASHLNNDEEKSGTDNDSTNSSTNSDVGKDKNNVSTPTYEEKSGTGNDSTNSSTNSDFGQDKDNVSTPTFHLEENLNILKENKSKNDILECLHLLNSENIPSESIMETDARSVLLTLTNHSGEIGRQSRLILSIWKKNVRQTIEANRKLCEIVDQLSETLNHETQESLLRELLHLPISASGIIDSGLGKVLLRLRPESGKVSILANQVHVRLIEHITSLPSAHLPMANRTGGSYKKKAPGR